MGSLTSIISYLILKYIYSLPKQHDCNYTLATQNIPVKYSSIPIFAALNAVNVTSPVQLPLVSGCQNSGERQALLLFYRMKLSLHSSYLNWQYFSSAVPANVPNIHDVHIVQNNPHNIYNKNHVRPGVRPSQ